MANPNPRSYGAGFFVVHIDGVTDTGYIKSVGGGAAKGSIISETVGPDFLQYKHVGTVDIEPITMEIGMATSKGMLEWIRASWTRGQDEDGKRFRRKNGSVLHADEHYKNQIEQEFTQALITETVFPALTAGSSDNAYLKVSFLPEYLEIKKGDQTSVQSRISGKQKNWSQRNFKLTLDRFGEIPVKKIDSFSVKQNVKKLFIGSARLPELEPAAIEFSNISFYVSAAHAGDLIDWHKQYVLKGGKDTELETDGAIEFTNGTAGDTIFTIKLKAVGIHSLSIVNSEANQNDIKQCKVDLYVEQFNLEFDGAHIE